MSRQDENPFADPNDINPFADPSVAAQTNYTQPTLDSYNPFDGQQKSTTDQFYSTPQPTQPSYMPATIEPTREEPQHSFQAKPFGGQDDTARLRQEELERKAAELDRKEQELQRAQAQADRKNNFPPLPGFCPVQPCFYHDINVEIPMESQRTCRIIFYIWQLYVFTLLFNFICALSILLVGDDGGTTMGTSILYFVVNIPCSFLFWYRPIYKALKSDSSFNYMIFFFVFFCQILFTGVMCIGIPGVSCGWILGTKEVDDNKAVAIMIFVCATLWTLLLVFKILLLKKVHAAYRRSGASLEKAQGEFASGVATNKDVQRAAAQAVAAGVTQNTR